MVVAEDHNKTRLYRFCVMPFGLWADVAGVFVPVFAGAGAVAEAGLKVKHSKCQLFCCRVAFLGHIVLAQGIEKHAAVATWSMPHSVKEKRKKKLLRLPTYFNPCNWNCAAP